MTSPGERLGAVGGQPSGFVFAPGGTRLYMRGRRGSLLVIHIPNSPREQRHPPRSFIPDEGQVIVAVGQLQSGRRTVVVTQSTDALQLLFFDAKVRPARAVRVSLAGHELSRTDSESPLGALGVIHASAAFFIHPDGSLVKIVHGALEVVARPPAAPSSESFLNSNGATKPLPEGLVFTWNRPGGEPHGRVHYVMGGDRGVRVEDCSERYEPAGPGGSIFFGIRGIASSMVWQGKDGRWLFKPARPPRTVPAGFAVIGLIERGEREIEAHLAVVDPSRTSIGCIVQNEFQELHRSDDRIAVAATSSAARHVAYLTEAGELVVFSSDTGVGLVRAAAGDL